MLIRLWVAFCGRRFARFPVWSRRQKPRRLPAGRDFAQTIHSLEARAFPGGSLANPATPFLAAAAMTAAEQDSGPSPGLEFQPTASGLGSIGIASLAASRGASTDVLTLTGSGDDPAPEESASDRRISSRGAARGEVHEAREARRGSRSAPQTPSSGLATSGSHETPERRSDRAQRSEDQSSAPTDDQTASRREIRKGTASPDSARSAARKSANGNLEGAQRTVNRLARRHGTPALNDGGNPVSNPENPSQGGQGATGGGSLTGTRGLEDFGNLVNQPNVDPPSAPSGLGDENFAVDPQSPAGGGGAMLLAQSEPEGEGSEAGTSAIGFYRPRISPGVELPVLGAMAEFQSLSTLEFAGHTDTHVPQIPGATETFDNVTTSDSSSETETGTDPDLGDYTRTIEWTTDLTRNGNASSYTETRLKTYTVVTEYTDENGFESTLTQTGTTYDTFELSMHVDSVTSVPVAWIATSHTETDAYSYSYSSTTSEVDAETGDSIEVTFSFAASGTQTFSYGVLNAPDSEDPDFSLFSYAAGQAESGTVGVTLEVTSASGLTSATTGLSTSGSYSWTMTAGRRQATGLVVAAAPILPTTVIDYELETADEYAYSISGQSSSALSHVASGTEVITRTDEVTPEGGGDPVSVTMTIDAAVDFNYQLSTDDEYEFSVEGEDLPLAEPVASYSYADEGSLEETLVDDSVVTVTSVSDTGEVFLHTDNDIDQETLWSYSTSASEGPGAPIYVYQMHGESAGTADALSQLSITTEEEGVQSSIGLISHSTSEIVTDEFDYTNITSIWPDEISIGISFSANQEILWSGSETSSYQVVDESEEDKRSEFTASSSVSYSGGVDTLTVANSIGLTAEVNPDETGSLEITSEYSSSYASSAAFEGSSQQTFEYREDPRNLIYTEHSSSVYSDGQLQSSSQQAGASELSVVISTADSDEDGAIEAGEFAAAIDYEQTDEFSISVVTSSLQTNQDLTRLQITNDTSEPGRQLWLDSFSSYEEEVGAGSQVALGGAGTLTVSDVQTTTDGFAQPEPVDEDNDGIPDEPAEPEPSATAVVTYVGTSTASSSSGAEGNYTLETQVHYDDIDAREPGNRAEIHSESLYLEGLGSDADPDGGDVSYSETWNESIAFLADGTITATVAMSNEFSQSGDYATTESLTADTFFTTVQLGPEPNPMSPFGALGFQPSEVNYATLLSSSRPSPTNPLRGDVTSSPLAGGSRATQTTTTYSDRGHTSTSQESASQMVTTATPNPAADPEDEESAYLYATQGIATAESHLSDMKFEFDYESQTDGMVVEYGAESQAIGAGSFSFTPPAPTSLEPGGTPLSYTEPSGISFTTPSSYDGTPLHVVGTQTFSDRYHESGENESFTQDAESEIYVLADGGEVSLSESTTLYSREADIESGTTRTGRGKYAGSALTEESTGTNSLSLVSRTFARRGSMGAYVDPAEGGATLPLSGHVFASGELPDAYMAEELTVNTTSEMLTVGYYAGAGSANDHSNTAQADYRTDVTISTSLAELSALWAYEDEEGELGDWHRYSAISSGQLGNGDMRFRTANSSVREDPAETDPAYTTHANRTYSAVNVWSHSDDVIEDDGQLSRTVIDSRTVDHAEETDFQSSGGPDLEVNNRLFNGSGHGSVLATTVYSGGYLAASSPGGRRSVVDPDSITQTVSKSGEAESSYDWSYGDSSDGPVAWEQDQNSTAELEYVLTYTRPDGEDPEESGLALSVTAYALTNHRHDLYTDSDPDAAWQDAVWSESTVTLSESLAADNEVHVTLSTTSTITLWEGASGGGGEGEGEGEGGITNPITSSSTTTGEYDFPLPAGPVNDYGLTHTGYDREGWIPYHFTYAVETNSEAGAPALDSTYSASTISPSAVVQYAQEPRMRATLFAEGTPVENEAPPASVTLDPDGIDDGATEPGESGTGCGCGCNHMREERSNDAPLMYEIGGRVVVIKATGKDRQRFMEIADKLTRLKVLSQYQRSSSSDVTIPELQFFVNTLESSGFRIRSSYDGPKLTAPTAFSMEARRLLDRELNLLARSPDNSWAQERYYRLMGDDAMAGMIALNRSQEIMDAWAGVFGSIASAPTTNATLNALVRANAPPRQAAVAVLDNATSSGSNARNASKSALCETLAPAKVTPSSLSARSIAEDARLHRMWEDSIRELHGGSGKAGRALREYLNVIEAGGTPTSAQARSAFNSVRARFARSVETAIQAGEAFPGYSFERIHHWNWHLADHSFHALDPRQLFPITQDLHELIHLRTTTGPIVDRLDIYFQPINPLHRIDLDFSYPLAPR